MAKSGDDKGYFLSGIHGIRLRNVGRSDRARG